MHASGSVPSTLSGQFEPLPSGATPPSELDANPRFLVLKRFRSRFLPGARDIVVYLPECYREDREQRFPVFYLNDGQNLMDGRTSYVPGHTWRAHSTADRLVAAHAIEPVILVGVANAGARRLAEYTPTVDAQHRGGDGPLYSRLLIEELKPLIDSTFRTRPGPDDTALGGSSLGGLISLAVGLDHPEVFGKIAVLSPSVWWDQRSILNRVSEARPKPRLRIWLDMGTAEGLRHLRDTDLLYRRLIMRGWRDRPAPEPGPESGPESRPESLPAAQQQDLCYVRVPGAHHNEDAWAARFDRVLRFLFPAAPRS
jgi:predicted alpha/beta superfamily hydrolase